MKIIFNLLPCMMNIITGFFFFISMRRLAMSGADSFAVAGAMAVWAGVYAIVSALLGTLQNRRNATAIILCGQMILVASMLGFLVFPGMRMQYVWLFGSGIGTAMFFAPFQVIVKLLSPQGENGSGALASSSAVYTFSWSFGLASGPFIAAMVWGFFAPESGWRICYMISIGLILMMSALIAVLHGFVRRKNAEPQPGNDISSVETEHGERKTLELPDLAVIGWIVSGIGYITVAMLRTQIPYRCTLLEMTTGQQGLILAVVSYVQAFFALSLWKSRRWMYHPLPVALASLCGIAALLVFALTSSWVLYTAAAALYGCYSGMFCFFFVYHSLANPEKGPRNVAVNEVIVGASSVFAPLASGVLADAKGSAAPFLVCAVLILLTAAWQTAVMWRWRGV